LSKSYSKTTEIERFLIVCNYSTLKKIKIAANFWNFLERFRHFRLL